MTFEGPTLTHECKELRTQPEFEREELARVKYRLEAGLTRQVAIR